MINGGHKFISLEDKSTYCLLSFLKEINWPHKFCKNRIFGEVISNRGIEKKHKHINSSHCWQGIIYSCINSLIKVLVHMLLKSYSKQKFTLFKFFRLIPSVLDMPVIGKLCRSCYETLRNHIIVICLYRICKIVPSVQWIINYRLTYIQIISRVFVKSNRQILFMNKYSLEWI